MNRRLAPALLLSFLVVFLTCPARAEFGCTDANIFENMFNIGWGNLFPFRIAGIKITGGPQTSIPPVAAAAGNTAVCTCPSIPVPSVGISVGFYEPAKLIEVVRKPYCSPVLFGTTFVTGLSGKYGGYGPKGEGNAQNSALYNVHAWNFPLVYLLDMFTPMCGDGITSIGLSYFTEIDPVWNDETLSSLLNPDIFLFNNPVATAACIPDSIAATAYFPIDPLYWCSGSWGELFPQAAWVEYDDGMPKNSSLMAGRLLMRMHRTLNLWQVSSDAAMCYAFPTPVLPKSGYKMNMLFPSRERVAHQFGTTEIGWGAGREIPGIGEDSVYLLWRWFDCCDRLW